MTHFWKNIQQNNVIYEVTERKVFKFIIKYFLV